MYYKPDVPQTPPSQIIRRVTQQQPIFYKKFQIDLQQVIVSKKPDSMNMKLAHHKTFVISLSMAYKPKQSQKQAKKKEKSAHDGRHKATNNLVQLYHMLHVDKNGKVLGLVNLDSVHQPRFVMRNQKQVLILVNADNIYRFMLWDLITYKIYSMQIHGKSANSCLFYFDKTDIVSLIFWQRQNIVKLYYLKPPQDEGTSSSEEAQEKQSKQIQETQQINDRKQKGKHRENIKMNKKKHRQNKKQVKHEQKKQTSKKQSQYHELLEQDFILMNQFEVYHSYVHDWTQKCKQIQCRQLDELSLVGFFPQKHDLKDGILEFPSYCLKGDGQVNKGQINKHLIPVHTLSNLAKPISEYLQWVITDAWLVDRQVMYIQIAKRVNVQIFNVYRINKQPILNLEKQETYHNLLWKLRLKHVQQIQSKYMIQTVHRLQITQSLRPQFKVMPQEKKRATSRVQYRRFNASNQAQTVYLSIPVLYYSMQFEDLVGQKLQQIDSLSRYEWPIFKQDIFVQSRIVPDGLIVQTTMWRLPVAFRYTIERMAVYFLLHLISGCDDDLLEQSLSMLKDDEQRQPFVKFINGAPKEKKEQAA